MEEKARASYVLCPNCEACPTVEVFEREVRIGEAENVVRLKVEEWNQLVRAIQQGELKEVQEPCGCGCCGCQ